MWVNRVSRKEDAFVAWATTGSGAEQSLSLPQLSRLGLPECGTESQRRVSVDFAAFHRISAAWYLSGFGKFAAAHDNHETWEFSLDGTRYLVPALALLRGMFRPSPALVPVLFRPQSIEQVYIPKMRALSLDRAVRCRRSEPGLVSAVTWMYSFPSARRMWASVYRKACGGTLGAELPDGTVKMAVRGLLSGGVFRVTSLSISLITSGETPLEFAAGHSGRVPFHATEVETEGSHRTSTILDETIPLRDGMAATSDDEWRHLEQLFSVRSGSKRAKHGARQMLDGILLKLGHGIGWRKVPYLTGNHVNAQESLRRWRADGTWGQVREILARTRGGA